MYRKKMMGWLILLVISVFGVSSANAQRTSDKRFKTWKVSAGLSGGIAGMSESFLLDSGGNLVEREGSKETTKRVDETNLQEIAKLLEELKLPQTRTKIVKGLRIYDGIYRWFTITLNGKDYNIEGSSFYDEKQVILTAAQKITFDKLKNKLAEIIQTAPSTETQKPSKTFKTWKISKVRSGGVVPRRFGYSLDSDGNFTKIGSLRPKKIDDSDLQEIPKLLEELNLPKAKTKTVKGKRVYDGVYEGFTITLDGKNYKVEGSSFYDETQVVLTAAQKKTLEKLKTKLEEIVKAVSPTETDSTESQEIPVQKEVPPIMTGKVWKIEIYRRDCVYNGGDFPNCIGEIILWRGKLTRRGNSFEFDAVWRNEKNGEEVRDKVTLVDAVRERVVFRRDGEEKDSLGKIFRGAYQKDSPNFIQGNDNSWRAIIELEK